MVATDPTMKIIFNSVPDCVLEFWDTCDDHVKRAALQAAIADRDAFATPTNYAVSRQGTERPWRVYQDRFVHPVFTGDKAPNGHYAICECFGPDAAANALLIHRAVQFFDVNLGSE